MKKNLLKPKRATYAKKLEACKSDTDCMKLVVSSGQPHAREEGSGWTPCIGQFIIFGDGIEATRWSFTSQHDATEKARELFRRWKKVITGQ